MVQNYQQQRIGELAQKQQGKPRANPYGTPGMSLNDAGDYRKMVPVDGGVAQQVKQTAETGQPAEKIHGDALPRDKVPVPQKDN